MQQLDSTVTVISIDLLSISLRLRSKTYSVNMGVAGLIKPNQLMQMYQSGNVMIRLIASKKYTNLKFGSPGEQSMVTVSRAFSVGTVQKIELSNEACPQGIQGDDCVTFKLWAENCRRYGLYDCDEQLQGIQSGRKTLAEVLAEQDQLIADIASQYRSELSDDQRESVQGIQEEFSAFPVIDAPCPQGIQGDDCERFKLWLENCHRFGIRECMQQYSSFKAGRQTLAQIFEEQDKAIRAAVDQVRNQQRRSYSTASGQRADAPKEPGESEAPLTQRQKLQRAVKEYGSTVIVFHVTISLASLGFFYLLVSSGIDVVGMLQKLGVGETILKSKLAAGTGTFVVAYAVHKVFAPVRIATTLTSTPFIVRYLRRIGFLKKPKVKSG